METLFDLPAHPLMVHLPVVAIPVLAIGAVIAVLHRPTRARYGSALMVLAVVAVVATFVAANSGAALADGLDYPESQIGDHRDLGNTLRWFVLGLGVATLGHLGWVSTARGERLPSWVSPAVRVLVVVFALLSLVWVIRTGHEGAKSVWEEPGALLQGGSDDVPDDVPEPTEAPATSEAAAPATTVTTRAPSTTVASTAVTTTVVPTTTAAPATTVTSAVAADTTEPAASTSGIDGEAVYLATCARCHATDGTGRPPRPSLIGVGEEIDDVADVIERVTEGGDFMPSFGDDLTPEEIAAVSEYVLATF